MPTPLSYSTRTILETGLSGTAAVCSASSSFSIRAGSSTRIAVGGGVQGYGACGQLSGAATITVPRRGGPGDGMKAHGEKDAPPVPPNPYDEGFRGRRKRRRLRLSTAARRPPEP
ncbi:MAG: hypothetical protein MZV63_34455 [Marinilabiliales bacterium]|nr:hypothetical protein [Marinilabiliales bacterium]